MGGVPLTSPLGDPLVTAYAVVTGGLSLHVRTCTPRFCISGTDRPIMFKFGVWVWSHYLPKCFTKLTSHGWGASARAHVRTPFPLPGNSWAHCADIKWVVSDQVAVRFIQVISWVVGTPARAHVQVQVQCILTT